MSSSSSAPQDSGISGGGGGSGGAAKHVTGTTIRGKDTVASGNAEVTATESKVTAAEAKVETAKLEVAAAEAKVAAAKQEVAAAEAKVAAAEAKVAAAKQEYRAVPDDDPDKEMLRDDWKIARKGLDGAQKGLDGAQKGLDSAQDGVKIARKGLDGAQDLLLRLQRASDTGAAVDEAPPAKIARRELAAQVMETAGMPPQLALDTKGQYVWVRQMRLAGFGSAESLLFVREDSVQLWDFLQRSANDDDPAQSPFNVSVEGPPGTGKSTEVWAWALWVAKTRKVAVVWYHLSKNRVVKVVLDGERNLLSRMNVPHDWIGDIRDNCAQLLIVDGVTAQESVSIKRECCAWSEGDNDGRRFVVVSSAAVRAARQENREAKLESFTVGSWTIEQYMDACATDGGAERVAGSDTNADADYFYARIKDKLKCPECPDPAQSSKEDLLRAKFFYAGGCVRWMFEFDFDGFRDDFNAHFDKVNDYSKIFCGGSGDATEMAVNHMRSVTVHRGVVEERHTFFVSRYALARFGKKSAGPQFFSLCYEKAHTADNPAFRGWVFEFDVDFQLTTAANSGTPFKAQVRACSAQGGGAAIETTRSAATQGGGGAAAATGADGDAGEAGAAAGGEEGGAAPYSRSVTKYHEFEINSDLVPLLSGLGPVDVVWAKPTRWFNKAYDFLCFWKTDGVLNMVAANATCAKRHDVKLGPVHVLGAFLSKQGLPVGRIRFDFLVPTGANFGVSTVEGQLCDWENVHGVKWGNWASPGQYFRSSCIVVADVRVTV